jgi:hypothetical protein
LSIGMIYWLCMERASWREFSFLLMVSTEVANKDNYFVRFVILITYESV